MQEIDLDSFAGLLTRRGHAAYSVAGGTAGWARTGRPIVRGPHTG